MNVLDTAPKQQTGVPKSNLAAFSPDISAHLKGAEPDLDRAIDECIRDVESFLEENAPEALIADIETLLRQNATEALTTNIENCFKELEQTTESPFYETHDETAELLICGRLLKSYWTLDNDSKQQPRVREAACAAYVSTARVYLVKAEAAETEFFTEALEEKALSYLIAGLATQARSDLNDNDVTQESTTADEDVLHPSQRWHDEAIELIDIIVNRREYRQEEANYREKKALEMNSLKREERRQSIIAELEEHKNNTGRWPTWEAAARVFSDDTTALELLKELYTIRTVQYGKEVVGHCIYTGPGAHIVRTK